MRIGTGKWILAAGVLMIFASVYTGNVIHPSLASRGLEGFVNTGGGLNWGLFFLFALGFPLGAGLILLGTAISDSKFGLRLRWLIPIILAGVFSALLLPKLLGRQGDTWFFGAGGYAITILFVATVWYWGQRRKRLPRHARLGADFQGLSHLFFVMAAWNLCGVGSAPSFLLQPVKVIELDTIAFAAGQMKTVMALLIFGLLFSLLSQLKPGNPPE